MAGAETSFTPSRNGKNALVDMDDEGKKGEEESSHSQVDHGQQELWAENAG